MKKSVEISKISSEGAKRMLIQHMVGKVYLTEEGINILSKTEGSKVIVLDLGEGKDSSISLV